MPGPGARFLIIPGICLSPIPRFCDAPSLERHLRGLDSCSGFGPGCGSTRGVLSFKEHITRISYRSRSCFVSGCTYSRPMERLRSDGPGYCSKSGSTCLSSFYQEDVFCVQFNRRPPDNRVMPLPHGGAQFHRTAIGAAWEGLARI